MSKSKSAAIVTLNRPGAMTAAGRRRIAAWLRRTAADFTRYGKDYSTTRFTARYRY